MGENIYLVGMMGSGKSSVAKLLAQRLMRSIADLDDMIVQAAGMPIAVIFARYGEQRFRALETEQLAVCAQYERYIVATGGGVVIRDENIDRMKQSGIVIYLASPLDELYDRIAGDGARPLLQADNPRKRLEEIFILRKAQYEKADYTIDTTGKNPDEITETILSTTTIPGKQ